MSQGRTVESAVEKALESLGTDRDSVTVEVVQTPKSSVFGLVKILAEVKVTLNGEEATCEKVSGRDPMATPNGLVWVAEGTLRYKPPEENGTPPALIVKPPVNAKLHGQEVSGRVQLDDGIDALELELPENEPPYKGLQVSVYENGLAAFLEGTRRDGRSFRLNDQPPTSVLQLSVEEIEKEAPRFTHEEIQQAVLSEGLGPGVDLTAVTDDALGEAAFSIEIARGEPAVEPTDEGIEFLFKTERTVSDETEERVDHYERNEFVSVDSEERLARKTPSVPGKPGVDVYGNPIPVPDPKPAEWMVGEGVELNSDRTEAYSVQSGMPMVQGGVLRVLKVYEISGDADLSTGHIRFKGEVIVRGSVAEKIQIQAETGGVEVFGMVSGAFIDSDQDIVIHKTAVSSTLHAGGMNVIYLRLLSLLHSLSAQIEDLIGGLYLLRRQTDSSDGKLLKTLLELKFKGIPSETDELTAYLSSQGQKADPDLHTLANTLKSVFVGRAPLQVQSVSEISTLLDTLNLWVGRLEEETRETSNVTVKYLQNCQVEASGLVKVTGQGCYYSNIVAGSGLKGERGVFRGGEVVVDHGPIHVKELGGPTGVNTVASIVRDGTISVAKAYPNAVVCIANQRFRFDGEYSRVKAYRNNDQLVVLSGHQELT